MSAPRWADLEDDDGPWPEPPEVVPEPSSYTPPHKRRPRLAAPKKLTPAKQEKEKAPK